MGKPTKYLLWFCLQKPPTKGTLRENDIKSPSDLQQCNIISVDKHKCWMIRADAADYTAQTH